MGEGAQASLKARGELGWGLRTQFMSTVVQVSVNERSVTECKTKGDGGKPFKYPLGVAGELRWAPHLIVTVVEFTFHGRDFSVAHSWGSIGGGPSQLTRPWGVWGFITYGIRG